MNIKFKIINYLNKLDNKPKKKDVDLMIKKYRIVLPKSKTTTKQKYEAIKKIYKIKKVDLFHEITIKELKKLLKKNKIKNNIGNKKKMFKLLQKYNSKLPSNNISAAYFTNIGKRDYQEDRIAIHNNFYYYLSGVFDGHAGYKCSTYLKQNFYKTFIKNLRLKNHIMGALYITFFELDKKFLDNIYGNDGSTANILFCDKSTQMCYVANTGDSRAILCRHNGSIKQITEDHKPNTPKEKQRIEKKGGFVRDNRTNGNLAMSRAFGDKNLKDVLTVEPDISYFPMRNIKYIVQASDGLFDVMSNSEVCSFVSSRMNKGLNIDKISKELVFYAINNKGTMDNTSVVITLIE